MNALIEQLTEFLETRTERERILICFVGILAIYILFSISFFYYNSNKETSLYKQISYSNNEITKINSKINTLSQQTSEDNNEKHQALNKQIKLLNEKLKIYTTDIVSPKQMINALKTVLSQEQGLQLISLQTSAAQPLTPKGKTDTNKGRPDQEIFKHDFTIKLKGGYFSLLKYLQDLEVSPWRIYWDSINYKVTQYPFAEITIQLHTLNTKDELINV